MTDLNKKVIVCDLDGTLTESKSNLKPDMAEVVRDVLRVRKMAIISGAGYSQFKEQFLNHLGANPDELNNLHLFPVNGSAYYAFNPEDPENWREVYMETLTDDEKKEIYNAFGKAIPESGVEVSDVRGPVDILEDRGAQITFSGMGQDAPLELKEVWDSNEEKRKKIVSILEREIPQFEIRIGGATSIDVTRSGINKAYAMQKIFENLNVSKDEVLFVGDALFPGGNDETAKESGAECISVRGPEETIEVLKRYI